MNLREVYDKMSLEDQETFWRHLNKVLLWRGWDRGDSLGLHVGTNRSASYLDVEAIANLFEENGCSVEEYT